MKPSIYILFAALLLTSSCLKVENVKLCNNEIKSPQLETYTYAKATGQVLQVTAVADTLRKDIIWVSPLGIEYKGLKLSVPLVSTQQSGNWSVYALSRVDGCTSDKTNFTVTITQSPPPCTLSGNYFKLGSNSQVNIVSSTCGAQSNYFGTHFVGSSPTVFMDVIFHDQPIDGGAYTINNTTNVNNLVSGQCAITTQISGSGFCYGQSGTVYTNYEAGKLKIIFCGLPISNFGNSQAILLCN